MLDIREMRKETGKTQLEFAQHFNIPIKTLQKWEQGVAEPPQYVPEMMEKILALESRDNKW